MIDACNLGNGARPIITAYFSEEYFQAQNARRGWRRVGCRIRWRIQ